MRKAVSVVFFLISYCSLAVDPKYPAKEIPEELKTDANIVVRENKMVYKILAKNKASLYSHYVVTILNAKGDRYSSRSFWYNKLKKITDLNAAVYDAQGNLIKRLRNNEIIDRSSFDGFSLYSDNRLKFIDLSQGLYPYTVEYELEEEFKYLYDFGGSTIISSQKVSVQKASYQIIYPSTLKPRYKAINTDVKPTLESLADGFESLLWVFENLKPVKLEPFGPDPSYVFPQVLAAPSRFEYDGYEGNMSTWEEYGKWNLLLNKGKDGLPETTKQRVKKITEGLTTTEQKTKALYEYLQSKTRYVSIQLGIGGLQPFDATTVDQTGYGDCKALSNYMVAMLREVGVKGYYTTVMAGENETQVMLDFPSHQSNHVIVAVPNGADTLWLECTSQTNPFGYQGTFTGNRKALMITETGGKIVNTIHYTADQNKQSRTADVFVQINGDAMAKVRTTYSGTQYENGNLNFVLDDQFDNQKKWIQQNTTIPAFDINSFSMSTRKEKIPSGIVNLDLTLKRLATVSGKRLFLSPNLMNKSTFIPEKLENRKTNVVWNVAYLDLDTIRYNLPEEIYPEFLPEPVKIKSRFGEYEAAYKVEQGKLIYIRRVRMSPGEFPPESYAELIDFYRNLNRADNTKIVFLTKT